MRAEIVPSRSPVLCTRLGLTSARTGCAQVDDGPRHGDKGEQPHRTSPSGSAPRAISLEGRGAARIGCGRVASTEEFGEFALGTGGLDRIRASASQSGRMAFFRTERAPAKMGLDRMSRPRLRTAFDHSGRQSALDLHGHSLRRRSLVCATPHMAAKPNLSYPWGNVIGRLQSARGMGRSDARPPEQGCFW